jgi:hypothetical protein
MDWKKIALVTVFSLIALNLQVTGVLVAISLLIYMIINGMDNCKIANIGLLLQFLGIFTYLLSLLEQFTNINVGLPQHVLPSAATYLIFIGTLLLMISTIVVMLLYNKLKGNIY